MIAEGHAVGSHSYSHPAKTSTQRAAEELNKTEAAIRAAIGRSPTLFRPPYGIMKGNLARQALGRGYTVVLWTVSSADTRPIGPGVIANNVIHTPNPGDIVLIHDGPGHKASADALPQILDELGRAGYRFVTIPELISAWAAWSKKATR
jgi:peptidoglycan/xylan/chitin deacetylase (PgdA/CDA1 family)